jgi:2-polyprenyl-6-methoxyphenol hydroxylase-like FAD-dependent oxidoreductase
MKEITIVGAGIGGLTTAIALQQKGFKIRIYEQAEQLKPVGAGIILANNAMQVYKKLGLQKVIEENGNPISSLKITKQNLRPLSKIDLTHFEQKNNVKNIAIHRGKLQQILVDQLAANRIHLNHKLKSIHKIANGSVLQFENGEQIHASIVLGADGLNSIVRKNILPNTITRQAKQICWRGVTEYKLPTDLKNELNEAWGKSERFGFVQITENKVYWYALKTFKENKNEFLVENLEQYFNSYNPVIKNIIKSTKKEHINTAEISDLKPTDVWFKDNICLMGDAAHATTPNMGQGACQAIEDAYVLAACLDKYKLNKAFLEYQKIRLPKAHQVVKMSWFVGKIAHLKNPLSIGLRNLILKLTPSSVNKKQNEQIFQLTEL